MPGEEYSIPPEQCAMSPRAAQHVFLPGQLRSLSLPLSLLFLGRSVILVRRLGKAV